MKGCEILNCPDYFDGLCGRSYGCNYKTSDIETDRDRFKSLWEATDARMRAGEKKLYYCIPAVEKEESYQKYIEASDEHQSAILTHEKAVKEAGE
jgi:antirestriction protein ArdC